MHEITCALQRRQKVSGKQVFSTYIERMQLHVERETLHFNLAFFELGNVRRC